LLGNNGSAAHYDQEKLRIADACNFSKQQLYRQTSKREKERISYQVKCLSKKEKQTEVLSSFPYLQIYFHPDHAVNFIIYL
jgi:hypothetical protein